ncbi:PH domain-containing protein [Arthrobacter sp. NamB2]|uniref:PH domain-containing protein n=1 Tax=Arthrobacter sp. NamB2 TaxID=2576035 RepID=UPI0010C95BAC|nr:PH domain-containing protein [Arthrobacter sp. NamB2]TKV29613.1 PH domain-containing protein [Arthrobacter sp. NamB2]
MESSRDVAGATVFKPRTSVWFTGIAVVVALAGLVSILATEGPSGLLAGWPLASIGYLGWWLFWYPAVVLSDAAVTLRNPLATIRVPWAALIDVDTRYALKLVTPTGSFTAWAAPAPGVWGTHAGKPEHVTNLPSTSYGPGGSIRPGDLKNTDSGLAAYLVRSRWQELVESGAIDVDSPDRARRAWNWPHIAVAVLLASAAAASLTLGS